MSHDNMLFRDLDAQSDGVISFAAAGIVEEYVGMDTNASIDNGKHMTVSYIDPLGNHNHEWRSIDEVLLTPVDSYQYQLVKFAIDSALEGG